MTSPMYTRTSSQQQSALQTNKVLRNTYALLAITLLWSAMVAGVTMALNLPSPGILIMLVGFYGLLFLLGFGLAPVVTLYGHLRSGTSEFYVHL